MPTLRQRRSSPKRLALVVVAGLAAVFASAGHAAAGGGVENVLLVVNDLSPESKAIANHYIRWRNLPDSNVRHFNWQGSRQSCSVERFREQLLKPLLKTIDDRKLSRQIDYVVYSAGFPWRIDLKPAFPEQQFPPELRPIASITGSTYLWRFLVTKNPGIVTLSTNWYVPRAAADNKLGCRSLAGVPTRGFRGFYAWDRNGRRVEDRKQGRSYLLSTMLGVTDGRGNSVDEVLDYLQRSIAADQTRPNGTFYFAKNGDVRSAARHTCYNGVVAALRAEGARAEVVAGTAPRGKRDIMGLTVGAQRSDLAAAGSSVLAGAICEHLTSFGGDLRDKAGQMPLTDFLRQGAAGASGTITEPRAIQAKFPLPSVHLHYRRGCSLAEAFYQSVAGPYQLLVVGDPLCQPWARPPTLEVTGIEANTTVRGPLTLTPSVSPAAGTAVAGEPSTVELYLDGRLIARTPSGRPLRLNSAGLADGHHEFRVVAASPDAIEARSRVVLPVIVDNHPELSLELSVYPAIVNSLDDWVFLEATAKWPPPNDPPSAAVNASDPKPASEEASSDESDEAGERKNKPLAAQPLERPTEVVFEHAGREIGRKPLGNTGPETVTLRVRARVLGQGPLRLRARLDNGIQAEPQWIVVK